MWLKLSQIRAPEQWVTGATSLNIWAPSFRVVALESCLYERVTPNSPNSLKICMLAIFWLQPVDQTWSKCEQMTLFTTIEIQIWLNKVSVCYVGAVIIFKMNDSAGSICFCHSIDPALPIDHDHIALPTYTYRLFILIDCTGSFSFLIMGMSVVHLLSPPPPSLSLSLSLCQKYLISCTHSRSWSNV